MKGHIFKICTLALLAAGTFACEKDYGDNLGPVEDSVAPIPVTVTNADAFERYPVVNTSLAAGGNFSITFEIPADKGSIREISKVATGPFSTINLTNLNSTSPLTALNATGTGTARVVTPIMGNGTNTITFTSNLNTYLAYRNAQGTPGNFGPAGPPATTGGPGTLPVPGAAATPTDIQYYFRLTLSDGSTVVPLPVRVRVLP